jgi:hypothetical protein
MIRLISAATLALFAVAALAQDDRGTISGQVTDASGAAIPEAKVRAIQKSTNQATEVVANKEGFYTLPYLPPSTYDVEVSAKGFKTMRVADLQLLTADKRELPIKLEVGGASAEVTVVAEAETLRTSDASGGLNFDSTMTSEFALNGRQVYMLMDLTPGVLFTQEDFGSTGYSGTRGWDVNGNFTISGGKTGSNLFSVNGAPVSLTGTFQIAPNVDAIQEFKVMANTYDATMGRTGGGAVNTTLKSGSNQWHGSAGEFMRNNVLDANYTQLNAAGQPRGKHIVNQITVTIGGPIRRNKDFFFASYEGWRERVPFAAVASVPPADLVSGQAFTKYNELVYDPMTSHACKANVDVSGSCNSTYIRDPFPGNTIPASRMSPIGKKILSFYPAPNLPDIVNNYAAGTGGKYRYDQPIGKLDHIINESNRLAFTFTFQDGQEYRNQTGLPGAAASGNINTKRRPQNYNLSFTRIISPTVIFDLRTSFGRFGQFFPNVSYDNPTSAESLGITAGPKVPTNIHNVAPRIALDQFTDLFGNGSNLNTNYVENQWNIVPSLTLVRGSMTLRFGVDLVYAARAQGDTGLPNGYLSFTRWGTWRYSTRTSALNAQDGSGVADLLLGIPASGQADWNDTFYRSWPYGGVYVQNDWKVRRNVTLNIGLRYDVQVPWVERWNRVTTGFDYNTKNPLSDQILANWRREAAAYNATNPRYPYPDPPAAIMGGKTYIQPGGRRRTYDTDWTDLQPRLGVAWSITRNTVLRTGAGIFYRTATQAGLTDGFSQTTNYQRSLDGDITPSGQGQFAGPYTLQNPFPDGAVQPQGASTGLLANIGNAVSYDARLRPIPRTYQYSFGIQRRLRGNLLLDVGYSGSQTVHDTTAINTDYWSYEFNQLAMQTTAYGDTTVNNPLYGVIPANRTFGTQTIRRRELTRLYPLFANVTNNTQPWGRYRFDALLLRVDKRFTGDRSLTGGLTLVFSYTFSKSLEEATYLNTWNFRNEQRVHQLTSIDKPQNLAISGVWSLPFGKGRHFATPNKILDTVVGGWSTNWSYRYTSGTPVGGINAVNRCGVLLVDDQSHDRWWNNASSCWAGNPSYMPRVVEERYAWLRWPDNSTVNLAASKTFRLRERFNLNLRGEAFNLLNTPIYKTASTTYNNASFGKLSIEQRNFPRNIQVAAKIMF